MSRKVVILILSLICLAIFLSAGIKERTVLIIEEQKTGEKLVFYPSDGLFELGYTHSVLLTPVDEFFVINENNNLVLQKTIYESLGAGLPYEQMDDADFEIVDGKFILTLNREFKVINMVISPIPEHSITINGEKKFISALFSDSDDNPNNTHVIKIYAIKKKVFHLGNF